MIKLDIFFSKRTKATTLAYVIISPCNPDHCSRTDSSTYTAFASRFCKRFINNINRTDVTKYATDLLWAKICIAI